MREGEGEPNGPRRHRQPHPGVAHRDYGYEGLGIEIWMFDDRLEVRSPGQLVEPVTLERRGFVKNKDIRSTLGISRRQATRVAEPLCNLGLLKPEGERRWRRYLPTK